ncbi:MAG TPA: hypothetical protein VND99_03185, partial [Candidatus Acidoferrales bacterium]|nr:hypothetical protein [Candidatus Acidoferrales bacterium]
MAAKKFDLSNTYLGEDLYTTLGLKKGPASTRAEIIKAFRRIQNETHTDRLTGNAQIPGDQIDPLITAVYNRLFDEAREAYNILSNEDTRQYYDSNRANFDAEMTRKRHNRGDEVAQNAIDTKEALRRADLLFKATEAQAPRRKAAEERLKSTTSQRDKLTADRKSLLDQNPYIGPAGEKDQKLAAFDAQIEELAQQLADINTEITDCDQPVKDLNDQFRADTEAKKAKEEEKRNEETIRQNELLIEQWKEQMRIAQEGLAGRRQAPPGEGGRAYWERQFYAAQEAIDNLMAEQKKRRGEGAGAPSGEGAAPGGEEAASGADGSAPGGESASSGGGARPGGEGASSGSGARPGGARAGEGTGTSHGFRTGSGQEGGTQGNTSGGQGWWQRRKEKSEESRRRKTQENARKQHEKEERDSEREREKAAWDAQRERERQQQKDAK